MGPPGLFAIHILTPPYFYKIATLCAAWDVFLDRRLTGLGGSSFPSEFTCLFPLLKFLIILPSC